MAIKKIIAEIDLEISRLQQAKAILSSETTVTPVKRGPGRPKGSVGKKTKSKP
jgi:hypothetical protein